MKSHVTWGDREKGGRDREIKVSERERNRKQLTEKKSFREGQTKKRGERKKFKVSKIIMYSTIAHVEELLAEMLRSLVVVRIMKATSVESTARSIAFTKK